MDLPYSIKHAGAEETRKEGSKETGGNANVMIFNTVQPSSGGKQIKKDGENGTPRGRTCQILKTYAVAADSPTADFAHTQMMLFVSRQQPSKQTAPVNKQQ